MSDLLPGQHVTDAGFALPEHRKFVVSADMSGAFTDITDLPSSGRTVCVDDLLISTDTDMEVSLQDNDGAAGQTALPSVFVSAKLPVQVTLRAGLFATAANRKLQAKSSTSGNVRIICNWHETH